MNCPDIMGLAIAPPSTDNYYSSLRHCQRITRQANSSFPVAFRLLPPAKRQAMEALYAFLRISDDLADEEGELHVKWQRLREWRAGLLSAIEGDFSHPIHLALVHAVRRFEIPATLLLDALDGVESDLDHLQFAAFQDLYPYCYRVASAVGLACVRVWGFRKGLTLDDARTGYKAAEAAGIAFQLTNILRDLNEDWARGRVYLPRDELARFGVSPREWPTIADTGQFRALMMYQVNRAKSYYRMAAPLDRLLTLDGRAIFGVMSGLYRSLLDEIEKDVTSVFARRIRVKSWKKGLILLRGWAVKTGWI